MSEVKLTYDLLYSPWIDLLTTENKSVCYNIVKVFENADNLKAINECNPSHEFSIYRLLVAILMDAVKISNHHEWDAVWKNGRFDEQIINAIKERCEGKLDLFDAKRPFYQIDKTDMSDLSEKKNSSVARMFEYFPSGTKTTHRFLTFKRPNAEKTSKTDDGICPACCAKGLIASTPFAHPGGAGFRGSIVSSNPPAFVMPIGHNMFETLMLNYILPNYRSANPENDNLQWQQSYTEGKIIDGEIGILTGLTFPNRKMLLLEHSVKTGRCANCGCQSDNLIRSMIFGNQGWMATNMPWHDPWVSFGLDKKTNKIFPYKTQLYKDVWRDFSRLFVVTPQESGFSGGPLVLQQYAFLLDRDYIDEDSLISFACYSFFNDKAHFYHNSLDIFRFKSIIMQDPSIFGLVSDVIKFAEAVGVDCFGTGLAKIADNYSDNQKKAILSAQGRLSTNYWKALEPVFKKMLLDARIQDECAQVELIQEWRKTVKRIAYEVVYHEFDRGVSGEHFVFMAKLKLDFTKKLWGGKRKND